MSKLPTKTGENRVSTLAYQAEAARSQRAFTVKYAFQKLQVHLKDATFYNDSTAKHNDQYNGESSNNLGAAVVQRMEAGESPTHSYNYDPKSFSSTINPAHGEDYESSHTPVQPVETAKKIENPLVEPDQPSELLDQAEAIASARAALDEIHNNPLFSMGDK